jgi:hypothetical protein
MPRRSNDFPATSHRSSIRRHRQGRYGRVRELDTLGAWLLEKMSRRATSAVIAPILSA